jgi:hypothetical protein
METFQSSDERGKPTLFCPLETKLKELNKYSPYITGRMAKVLDSIPGRNNGLSS